MEDLKKVDLNKLMLRITWGIIIGSLLWIILSDRIHWLAIIGLLFPGYRYLIIPIFSKPKEEYLDQLIDKIVPFSTLQGFLIQTSPIPGGTLAKRLGGIIWFLILIVYNGYRSLYYDSTFREESVLEKKIPDDSIASQLRKRYHLADFQEKQLYELEKSKEESDHQLLKQLIEQYEQQELSVQLNPLNYNNLPKR